MLKNRKSKDKSSKVETLVPQIGDENGNLVCFGRADLDGKKVLKR